jgi:two-component system, LytTR family, response regulator
MLKSIIIDDEFKSREVLKALIEKFCDEIEVSASCKNGDEAITAIHTQKPDVIFLDIQLQGETGFEILDRLDKIDFEIIFTTAYSEFAIKAFNFSAIDYLLKPIDVELLRKAVQKARKRTGDSITQRVAQLAENLKGNSFRNSRLAIPANDGLEFITVGDIIYCEASGNYTNIYLGDNRKFIVSRTLKEYEDLLQDQDFFRIHNSHLINLNAIKKYIRGDGGQVVMKNDKALDVSKMKKKSFMDKIKMKE